MNITGILEMTDYNNHKKNYSLFLECEKFLVEKYFNWLELKIDNKHLKGSGVISPIGCKREYIIDIDYSPFNSFKKYDKIFVREPNINFNEKIHMYRDTSLCLYYPSDHYGNIPLFKLLPWISEWLVKYELYQRYLVWIGNEAPH